MFQKSSWSQRPLPENMISYAATDSRYLIYLRYTLLLIALDSPTEKQLKAAPFLKGNLRFKQLAKLYVKNAEIIFDRKRPSSKFRKQFEKVY